jgi:catechol 2,3-dioxygenase-like lactoylglutathione lyase family enzyme
MVLQDVRFQVQDAEGEATMLSSLFQGDARVLSDKIVNGRSELVVGFGPSSYKNLPEFHPGVSSFSSQGGHATLTFHSQNVGKKSATGEELAEFFEPGNGLQFVRIGAEQIRLSKAIQNGANLKYAYGWVDLDSPGAIPFQVVVGTRRDPISYVCLRVSDVRATEAFLSEALGMRPLDFADSLARVPGSDFEPRQPKDSAYLGYGPDLMGVLLVPPGKATGGKGTSPVVVGTQLEALTVVVDKSAPALPQAAKDALASGDAILSPDGYPFVVQSYTDLEKQAVTTLPPKKNLAADPID